MKTESPLLPWLLASLLLHLGAIGFSGMDFALPLSAERPPLLLRIERMGPTDALVRHRRAAEQAPALARGGRQEEPVAQGLSEAARALASGESGADSNSVADRADRLARRARSSYEQLLAARLERHKSYPAAAARRGLEGDAVVGLSLGRDGRLLGREIVEASSSEILDRAALAMVDRAAPFPALPEEFDGRSFDFEVPVSFRLD